MSRSFFAVLALKETFGPAFTNLSQRLYRQRYFLLAPPFTYTSYWLFTNYVVEVSFAEGPSMYPTIPDDLSPFCVNKTYARGKGIKVGDCVQIANPLIPRQYSNKRVIGLPGDYVMRTQAGRSTPEGVSVKKVRSFEQDIDKEVKEDEEDEIEEPDLIQVPEGHVWVEGDNLGWSRDSRTFGPVPMALIKGRSSWYHDPSYIKGFGFTSLHPGKGLKKIEDNELKQVLGEDT